MYGYIATAYDTPVDGGISRTLAVETLSLSLRVVVLAVAMLVALPET